MPRQIINPPAFLDAIVNELLQAGCPPLRSEEQALQVLREAFDALEQAPPQANREAA